MLITPQEAQVHGTDENLSTGGNGGRASRGVDEASTDSAGLVNRTAGVSTALRAMSIRPWRDFAIERQLMKAIALLG